MIEETFPELLIEPISTQDPVFNAFVQQLWSEDCAVVVLKRSANMAGAKDYYLIHNIAEFHEIIADAREKTSISIFLDTMTMKGPVNQEMATEMLHYLMTQPESERELFVICLDTASVKIEFGTDMFLLETAEAVETWVQQHTLMPIIAGGLPFWERNSEHVITAYVPDADDVIRPGAY